MECNALQARSDTAWFTFGRFQPPTIGHARLIDSVESMAAADGADAYIFVSSKANDVAAIRRGRRFKTYKETGVFESYEANENPLSADQKLHWLAKMYPNRAVTFVNTTACRAPPDAVHALLEAGYKKLVMLVGTDRYPVFSRLFAGIPEVTVRTLERNVSGTNTSARAMSGTKMRIAAVAGDVESFKRGVMIGNMTEADVYDLMAEIQAGLGLDTVGYVGSSKTRRQRRSRRARTRKN